MMKRSVFAAVMAALLAAACSGNFSVGGMARTSISVSPELFRSGRGTSSTILPETPALDDLVFDALLTAEGRESLSLTGAPYDAIRFEAVELGPWTLTVTARDSSGSALYRGSAGLTAGKAEGTVSVTLVPLQEDRGTLEFSLSWPEGLADGARAALSEDWEGLADAASSLEEGVDWDWGENPAAALKVSTQRESGTWYFSLELTRGGVIVAVVQSLVRIYDHRVSSADVALQEGEISSPPAAPSDLTLSLDPDTGDLVLEWTDNSNTEEGFRVYRDGVLLETVNKPGQADVKADRTEGPVIYKVAAYNDFGETFSPAAEWGGTGSLDLTFSLSLPEYGKVVFPVPEAAFQAGDELSLAPADPGIFPEASWKWYRNGALVEGQTSETFLWTPSEADVGDHIISVTAALADVTYSGDLKITVVPGAPETSYKVTYSSLGADGGNVPVDLKSYTSGESVTLLTNSGSLTKGTFRFLGWKTSADGSGEVRYPGGTLTMGSADLVLYPVWEDMVSVQGGTFQRDGTTTNLSAVSSFLMGRFSVTNAQWYEVMGGSPTALELANPNHPKGNITWGDAISYCDTLSIQQGLEPVYAGGAGTMDLTKNGYRLPTQSEYMWAAMGGLSDSKSGHVVNGINTAGWEKAYAGEGLPGSREDYAWTKLNSPTSASPTGEIKPVGTRFPNEMKIHDLTGNTFQWIWDNTTTVTPPGLLVNYATVNDAAFGRIHKGGTAYRDDGSFLIRSAIGNGNSSAWADVGFRVVRNAPEARWFSRTGLVGEWLLNGNLNDSSGQARHLELTGGTATLTADRRGRADKAYQVAYETLLRVPVQGFSSDETFSVSGWFSITDFMAANAYPNLFMSDMGSGRFNCEIVIAPGPAPFAGNVNAGVSRAGGPSAGTGVAGPSVGLNTWFHAVMVYDAGTRRVSLYINGAKIGTSEPFDSRYNLAAAPSMFFGQFRGYMDDLRIFSRALDTAEVLALSKE